MRKIWKEFKENLRNICRKLEENLRKIKEKLRKVGNNKKKIVAKYENNMNINEENVTKNLEMKNLENLEKY